jgi:isoquinoline 1-oxidoreductase alpha subunit
MITLTINGERREVDVPLDMPLLCVLRDVLGLTGTKFGCGIAQCGACTVHLAGKPVRSCLLSVGAIAARAITTIEGLGVTPNGTKVQKAWRRTAGCRASVVRASDSTLWLLARASSSMRWGSCTEGRIKW